MAEINKAGVPGKDTVGKLGDIYTNTNTGDKYKLVYIFTTTTYDGVTIEYDWRPLPTEPWTFEMVDGTTITKRVIIE